MNTNTENKVPDAQDLISRQEVIDWLAHRCDYAPPCGKCAYCRVANAIQAWSPAKSRFLSDTAVNEAARDGADLFPKTTYKNKRHLLPDERFKLNAALNQYLFDNCEHDGHDGYPNHLACRWCALEVIAAIVTKHLHTTPSTEAQKCVECGHDRNDPRRRGSDEFSTFCVPGCGCKCAFSAGAQTLYDMFEEWRLRFPERHRPERGAPETERLLDAWIAGFAKHHKITCAAVRAGSVEPLFTEGNRAEAIRLLRELREKGQSKL
jgi:hypothetical protein